MFKSTFSKNSSENNPRRSFFKKALGALGGLILFSPASKILASSDSNIQIGNAKRKYNPTKTMGYIEYLGSIKIFSGNFAPTGWMFCNGQILSIAQYSALFSLLGTYYGGDGISTFALPNLQGCMPIGAGIDASGNNYILGETGGTSSYYLNIYQIPPHTHTLACNSSASTNTNEATNNFVSKNTPGQNYSTTLSPPVNMSPEAIGLTGQGESINNMPPYLAINYIICYEGYYPPRP